MCTINIRASECTVTGALSYTGGKQGTPSHCGIQSPLRQIDLFWWMQLGKFPRTDLSNFWLYWCEFLFVFSHDTKFTISFFSIAFTIMRSDCSSYDPRYNVMYSESKDCFPCIHNCFQVVNSNYSQNERLLPFHSTHTLSFCNFENKFFNRTEGVTALNDKVRHAFGMAISCIYSPNLYDKL